MDLGLYLVPDRDGPVDVAAAARESRRQVRLAGAAGYRWVGVPGARGSRRSPVVSPSLWTAMLSALHPRVRFLVGASLGLEHPARQASAAAALDVMTDGRVALSLERPTRREARAFGLVEPEAVGDEAAELLAACLRDGEVSFAGRAFQLDRFRLVPRPLQYPSPPIYLCCRDPNDARLCARLGWGAFLPALEMAATQELEALVDAYRSAWTLAAAPSVALATWASASPARERWEEALHTYARARCDEDAPESDGRDWRDLASDPAAATGHGLFGDVEETAARIRWLTERFDPDLLLVAPLGGPDRFAATVQCVGAGYERWLGGER